MLYLCPTASNTESLEKLEELLGTWSKQIEQVLAESEQMRREADDIGPTAELAYWKSRMAKFNKYVFQMREVSSLRENGYTKVKSWSPVLVRDGQTGN